MGRPPVARWDAAAWGGQTSPRVGLTAGGRRGLLPVGRHAPTLAVLGEAEELPDGRGPVLRGRAQAEVVEDPLDRDLVGQPYVARSSSSPFGPWMSCVLIVMNPVGSMNVVGLSFAYR